MIPVISNHIVGQQLKLNLVKERSSGFVSVLFCDILPGGRYVEGTCYIDPKTVLKIRGAA